MKERLRFLVALALGALFLWSGLVKVKDPLSFAEAVRHFRIVGDPVAPALAHFLPWLEIFAGLAVMTERWRRAGAAWLTLLLLGFTLAVLSAWARGLDIACGCFGESEAMNYPLKLAQNLALVAASLWLWWRPGGRVERDESPEINSCDGKPPGSGPCGGESAG